MKAEPRFEFPLRGPGRPQILLIGNGLEREDEGPKGPKADSGKSWEDLLMELMVADPVKGREEEPDYLRTKEEKQAKMDSLSSIPFPLRYQLLSTSRAAPYPLGQKELDAELKRLSAKCRELGTLRNRALARLPELGADHIFTTNYSYSLERAFLEDSSPRRRGAFRGWIMKDSNRTALRFNVNDSLNEKGKPKRENAYRLHSGYSASNADGSPVGLWHIHGECGAGQSIILGHDGYGRLLSRMVECCAGEKLRRSIQSPTEGPETWRLCSWPALFLAGDVYILGFGLAPSEFDLWWLLRRKQREAICDGRVYFYDTGESPKDLERNLLLRAHGVLVNDGVKPLTPRPDHSHYRDFYAAALDRIQTLIRANRGGEKGV